MVVASLIRTIVSYHKRFGVCNYILLFQIIILGCQRKRYLFVLKSGTLGLCHILLILEDMLVLFHEALFIQLYIVDIETLCQVGVSTLIASRA